MDRKHFLGMLLVLPVGIFLVHCGSDSSSSNNTTAGTGASDPDAPAAAPSQSGGMDVYASSTVSAHHHTFTVDDTAFASPPADGASGDSSTDEAHSHTVDISADQLAQVAAGDSVKVTSGTAGGHTHVFTFVKIA